MATAITMMSFYYITLTNATIDFLCQTRSIALSFAASPASFSLNQIAIAIATKACLAAVVIYVTGAIATIDDITIREYMEEVALKCLQSYVVIFLC